VALLTAIEKSDLLEGVPLFGGLDEPARQAIAARAVEVEFPPHRPIARQGEVGTGFFLIVRGRVRVVHDGVTIAHLGPGDVFGEISLLDQMPRIASVVAEEDTVCLAVASWDFERLLEEQPRLAIGLLRTVARRLREVTEMQRH
jgi:CRP-like cAMP-binding protein